MPVTSTPTRMKKNDGAVRQKSVGPNHRRPVRRVSANPATAPRRRRRTTRSAAARTRRRACDRAARRSRRRRTRSRPTERTRTWCGRRTAGGSPRAASGSASSAAQARMPGVREGEGRRPRRSTRRCASAASAPGPRSPRRRRSPAPSRSRMSTLSVLPRMMSSTRSWPSVVRPPSTSDWTRNRIASTQIQPPRLTIGQAACQRVVAAPEPAAHRERGRHAGREEEDRRREAADAAGSTRTRRWPCRPAVVQASSVCQPTMMTTARPRIQSR